MILTSSSQISESDILLDAEREGTSALEMTAASSLKEMEKIHIRRVLESTGWNKTRAAEILGIGRTNIYEKIRQYGLTPSS